MVKVSLSKKQDPISRITRTKRARGMAQAVECLSRNYEALSSNHSTIKKRKKRIFKMATEEH
jgi:RecB family endonuclease NucS